jgi:hypothetical protein
LAPGVGPSYATAVLSVANGDWEFVTHRSPTTEGRFVVASQDCDIVAKLDVEPYVEALGCSTVEDANKRKSYARSARYFEVDPITGLVVHAMHRVLFDKRALPHLTPSPWPASAERLKRFIRWLGRRYTRPPLPDDFESAFVTQANDIFSRLAKRPAFRKFNEVVEDIRIYPPTREKPPFVIDVMLLLAETGISKEAAEAIDEVLEEMTTRLNPDQASIRDVFRRTRATLSVKDYFDTAPLFFETRTYAGDEVLGAEPPPPA